MYNIKNSVGPYLLYVLRFRLWVQQPVPTGPDVIDLVWQSALRRARAFRGQTVRRTEGRYLGTAW